MKRFCPLVCTIWLWLIALIVQPVALSKGRVEHHQMTSKILADAGQPADRELSVYLPEEYDTSELAYPVLYLIHGGSLSCNQSFMSNRVWFMYGVDSLFDGVPEPMIIVMPSMGGCGRDVEIEEDYLVREIIPFVDDKYRAIPYREGRAISGLSRGGVDALYIALSHPELFSVVAGISAGDLARDLPERELLEAHNQELFPLQFWLAYGQNEQYGITVDNREFVKNLEELGLPYVYVEDDSDHFNLGAVGQRMWVSLEFVSKTLGGGIVIASVELHSKLPKMWGEIKFSK